MKKSKLNRGNAVSLQSLSSGIAGDERFLHRFEIGKSRIEEMGLRPLVSENSLKGIEYISKNPAKRAKDLMDAFIDPKVKLIISNIGGFDSHELIPFLSKDIISGNPKPILGFSDITSLHLFMYNLGIQTYYGPMVLDGFAENVEMHNLTKESVEAVLFKNDEQILSQSKEWTSEFLEWSNKDFDGIKRKMNKENQNPIWVNFSSDTEGHLIGGCLDTIAQIKNESFFPKIDAWKESIIFLETSEQKMSPENFRKAIIILKDEIEVCNGIIFGKPKDEAYFSEYLNILNEEIKKPFIFNLNFGHTAPVYTIPYGGKAILSYRTKAIFIKK